MGFARKRLALLASAAIVLSGGAARAICAYPDASYQGGAYGAYAATTGYCYAGLDQVGGVMATVASASSIVSTPYTDASSSATLSSGALTAYSAAGSASASLWDTFTYSGLPAGVASVQATLTLPGTLTGNAFGFAQLEEGTQSELQDGLAASSYAFFDASVPIPNSILLTFNVMNGVSETVFSEITGFGDGLGGIADLTDPPTLSLSVPRGASVVTASGVFDSFKVVAIPETSTWAMMVLGFAGLGFAGSRQARVGRATLPARG